MGTCGVTFGVQVVLPVEQEVVLAIPHCGRHHHELSVRLDHMTASPSEASTQTTALTPT